MQLQYFSLQTTENSGNHVKTEHWNDTNAEQVYKGQNIFIVKRNAKINATFMNLFGLYTVFELVNRITRAYFLHFFFSDQPAHQLDWLYSSVGVTPKMLVIERGVKNKFNDFSSVEMVKEWGSGTTSVKFMVSNCDKQPALIQSTNIRINKFFACLHR